MTANEPSLMPAPIKSLHGEGCAVESDVCTWNQNVIVALSTFCGTLKLS